MYYVSAFKCTFMFMLFRYDMCSFTSQIQCKGFQGLSAHFGDMRKVRVVLQQH